MAIDWGTEFGGNSPQQPDSAVSAIENNPEVAAQFAAIDRLQRAKDITKRQIDQMGQISSETPGGIFGRKWSYGGKVYTDQQLADAKSAVDRAQNDNEIYQAIRNLANANDQSEVGTGVGGMLARGMNNTPIPSIGNNSFLGNNRTKYEYPEDDSSWAYTIGKYGGGGLELASDVSGAADTLKMAKAARFNPFTFAGMLYRDAKQTGKDIVNLPGNIVNGIRNAGNKTSDFVKDSIKAGTEGKSLKAYRTPAPAGETAQTGGRAAETAAPATERTAASETAAPAPQQPAPAPRQEQAPAPQQPAPAPRQEPAPAEGLPELRSNADGTPDIAGTINGEGTGAAGREAAAGEAAADGGVSELANAGNAGRETAAGGAAARQGAGEAAGAGGQAAGRGAAPAAEAGGQAPVDRLAALPDWAMGQVPTSQLQAMIEAAIQNDPIAQSVFSKIAFAKHGSVALDSFLSRGLSKFFNREDLITIGNAINRARKTGGLND